MLRRTPLKRSNKQPLVVSAKNIDDIIRNVVKAMKKANRNNPPALPFLVGLRINRETYKGRGRPRKSDYEMDLPLHLAERKNGFDFIK